MRSDLQNGADESIDILSMADFVESSVGQL
jgi:hypothetical protein